MAETTEKVLISIEIEKGENEKEIDQLTRKITDLQTATANLQKQNNELIKSGKQNSQEYVENTRQIEINKQKIGEAISTRKGMIQSLIAEDNSIKALRVRNAELIKQRDQLSTVTESGRIAIANINAEIDKNNAVIKENVSAQEKQRLGVGGYTDALDKLVPGLGATVNGIKATTSAALEFIKTPLGLVLGAIGLAIAAVTSYFKGSEEGQNRWNKIVAVGSAILEQFMNVMEDVGEVIVDAFENPKQAAKDFISFLESQFVNRITGMINLIPSLASAVEQIFKGNFAEAGKIAGDAVGKVVLGIENATERIGDFFDATNAMIQQGIMYGEKLAALNAQIDKDERALIVSRAQTALEVSKLREEALQFEGDARKKVLLEAIALEEQLAAKETELARNRLELAKTNLEANGDDKAALKEVAEARAAVFAAEATAFQNSLRFRKEIAAIDEASAKEQAKLLEEANAMLDKALEEELKRKDLEREAIIGLEELRLETEIARATSIEERVNKEIELETFKALTLLANEQLLESERLLIAEKSQKAINDIVVKANDEKNKKQLDADKKLAAEKAKLRQAEVSGINASLDAAVGLAKEAFGENKAIAVAETVINTVRGIVRAIADYPFPYSLIVSALVGAIGTVQTAKIAGIKFAHGGMVRNISRYGGVLRGPSHARGGIPFAVNGQPGFEAEGGEAIINKRSTRMFRKELSMINQAGGGVAFGRGGMTYAAGNVISGTQTRQASAQAESRTAVRDAVQQVMESMPPIVVSVQDINERSAEVSEQTNKANVI
jgi:hypothetical protein